MKEQQMSQMFCKNHNKRIIQFGNCLTCSANAPICEVKGCIKSHSESESVHNIVTIEYIRQILKNYEKSDEDKKSYLKKMVHEYFQTAKKQLQNLYNQVFDSVQSFKFDNIILNQTEKKIANNLINQKYHSVTCSQIAIVLPKLIKCTNFEDGHFVHIRNYLVHEKDKIHSLFYSTILNLPYFRSHGIVGMTNTRFSEVSSDWLREVNDQIKNLTSRPKNLRIKYVDVKNNNQYRMKEKLINQYLGKGKQKQINNLESNFVRLLNTSENLIEVQKIQIYCTWDIKEEPFQVDVFEALEKMPYLNSISIITGYRVSDFHFIEDLFKDRNIQIQVSKKQWHFQ